MLSCLRRMDCMLHITICKKDTREGHLIVAKPEDPPSAKAPTLLGTLGVSCRNGLNVDWLQTDVGCASLSHWIYFFTASIMHSCFLVVLL